MFAPVGQKDGGTKPKSNLVCHHCGKIGHIQPECRTLQREKLAMGAASSSTPTPASATPTSNFRGNKGNHFNNNNNNNSPKPPSAFGGGQQPMADGRNQPQTPKQTPVRVPAPGTPKSN